MVVYKCKSTSNQVEIGLEDPSQIYIGDLTDAYNRGVLISDAEGYAKTPNKKLAERLTNQPPNLTLNVHGALPGVGELWAFAMVGIALQFVAVAIPALMTYYWGKPKDTKAVEDYAYPTFLLGTCLLVVSMALCSYIIEATTVEQVFIPTEKYEVKKIFRLQLQQNMGDQPFRAYVILNHPEDLKIRTSRYDPEETDQSLSHGSGKAETQGLMVIIAVVSCLAGFVCQFVGLRALHWSATVIQLGITLLMTCIRVWIRRGISNQPITFQLPDDPDPNWIALSLGSCCRGLWPNKGEPWSPEYHADWSFHPYDLPVGLDSTLIVDLITIDDPRIVLREKLQLSISEIDRDLVARTERLRYAMTRIHRFGRWHPSSEFVKWEHVVVCRQNDSEPQYARLRLEAWDGRIASDGRTKAKALRALLALWSFEQFPQSRVLCVAKVFSVEDWTRKKEFLEKMIDAKVSYIFRRSKGGMKVPRTGHNQIQEWDYTLRIPCAGLSIESMQWFNRPAAACDNSFHGYIAVQVGVPADHGAFELLAGFMDALWRGMNLKYHEKSRHWYAERNMSDEVIDTDKVVRDLIGSWLVSSEIDAKVLVFSSLARCTVWKNPPDPDEPTITTDQDFDSSSPSIPGTQDESLRREESKRNTSGKAKADEGPRVNAETPGEPEHRPISAPSIPTTSISEAVQAAESSRTDAIAPEGSVHQPTSTQNGPVPSLSAAVQEGHSSRAGAITLDAPEDEPTLRASTPSPRASESMSAQHDKGKHTEYASVLHD